MKKKKIIFAASSGGHLTQMLQLEELIKKYNYVLVTEKNGVTKNLYKKYNMKYLFFTSRKKFFHFIVYFPINIILSLIYFLKFFPDIIITTGAGNMLPICLIAKAFKKKVIYIESFARIHEPSLTGRFFYKRADYYVSQWEELKKVLPNALYFGKIY